MIARMRLDAALPPDVPEPVRLLGRCAAAGLPTGPCAVVLDTSPGSDLQLARRLGPLPPGRVDLLPVGGAGVVAGVPTDDVHALADGLRKALSSGSAVLVQPDGSPVHAGRATIRAGSAVDVARAVEGQAHELATAQDVRRLELPVLRRRQRAHRGADEWRTPLPPWGMRLSRLLRDVRRVLPCLDLDVEWADDGRVCRLLQVSRPRT